MQPSWIDELNLGNYGVAKSRGNSAPLTIATRKKKDFWTDQISTGGGLAGALAGGAGGAAIGSVVPGAGTAIGGLVGAILGGAAGSGGGEFAENNITGEEDKWKNVGTEALIGGATSIPVGAGLKLARAGVQAGTGIGKKSAADLVQEAGVQTVGRGQVQRMASAGTLDDPAMQALGRLNQNKLGRLGARAEEAGSQMLASQSLITASQARKMGLKPVETFKTINRDYGLNNMDDMAEFGRSVTGAGADSILDTVTRAAVNEAPGIKLPDLRATSQSLIDNSGSLLDDAARKRLLNHVKNASTTMNGGSKGSISTTIPGGAALDQANAFRSVASDLTSGFSVTPEQKQLGNIYNRLAQTIEDGIYTSPGVGRNIQPLAKSASDDLLRRAQELRSAGNNTLADANERLAQQVLAQTDLAGIRALKKPFVDISKIDNATSQAQSARTMGGADLSKRAGEVVRNPMNIAALPLDAASPHIGGALAGAGRLAQGGAGAAAEGAQRGGQRLLPLAGRQAIGTSLVNNDVRPGSLEDALLAEGESGVAADPLMGDGQAMQPVGQSPYSRENLMSDIQRDPTNADKYVEYYQMLQEVYAPPAGTELTSGQQKTAVTAQNALNDIGVVANALDSGSIDRTLVPFNENPVIGNALGVNDLNAALYNIGDVILRSRTGAAAPKEEVEKFIAGYLPRAGESRETQLYKLQRAYSELQGMVNPPATLGTGTASSLEDALLQQSY